MNDLSTKITAADVAPSDVVHFTREEAQAIVLFCERAITRRRSLPVAPWDALVVRERCHMLSDIQHLALGILAGNDDHDELQALIDEFDDIDLYRCTEGVGL